MLVVYVVVRCYCVIKVNEVDKYIRTYVYIYIYIYIYKTYMIRMGDKGLDMLYGYVYAVLTVCGALILCCEGE